MYQDSSPLPHLLAAEDFHDTTHGHIFQAIQKNFAEKGRCSFVDLCTQFDSGLLANLMILDQAYFPAVDEDVAKAIREFRIRRVAKEFSVGTEEAKVIIQEFTDHTKKLTDLLPNARRDTLDVFNELHDKPAPWIPTGFPSIDTFVNMHKGNLVTIGARTRHGKSSFMINVAAHAMRRGERVDYCTKEMTDREILPRFIECITGKRFVEGRETIDTEILSRLNIHAVSSIQDVATICAQSNADLIFVDYIQILSSGRKSENRVTEIEFITSQLKNIAMTTQKCLVCASQISRTLDTASRDPVLSDLRGSGSIEQDSNIVILLYNNAEEKGTKTAALDLEGRKNDVDVFIAKNRLGSSGRCTLQWQPDVCRFLDSSPKEAWM
jgi:replicative DNA helicase